MAVKINIAGADLNRVGGGWTFVRNLMKALKDKVEFVNSWQESDIVFIAGATMIDRDTIKQAKNSGKKLILRVDNIPKNSRNRNTGTSRLKDYSDWADAVIYQSEWAKDYVGYFLKKKGKVIHNGVNTDIFNTKSISIKKEKKYAILYTRFNRDDSKSPQVAFMLFHYFWRRHPNSELWIVGVFSDEMREYNFDFFMDEPIVYFPPQMTSAQIAQFYRGADITLIPYWMDACSNTLIESNACGTPVIFSPTGGNPEITSHLFNAPIGEDMNRNVERMEKLLKVDRQMLSNWTTDNFNLDIMGKEYLKVFEEVL